MISLDQLAQFCTRPASWLTPLNEAMAERDIDSDARVVSFLAVCAYESNRFARLEENLNYSASGLLRMWERRFSPQDAADYQFNPERIANRAYANRGGNGDEDSGDGWLYRGRGPLQITFRNNYARYGEMTGLDLLADPDQLAQPIAGARVAAAFWQDNGCNEVADEGDFAGVSGIINRGDRHKVADGMDKRMQWLRIVQNALA